MKEGNVATKTATDHDKRLIKSTFGFVTAVADPLESSPMTQLEKNPQTWRAIQVLAYLFGRQLLPWFGADLNFGAKNLFACCEIPCSILNWIQ